MNKKANYTQKDCEGIVVLVGTIVGHSVDCAVGDGSLVGGQPDSDVYQIMPTPDVERTSPMKEFWWDSDYGKTRQFWDSPVAAGLHYAKQYLLFVTNNQIGLSLRTVESTL